MKNVNRISWIALILVNALIWFGVVMHQTSCAAQRRAAATLTNPVEQRREMIRALSEIKRLLQEQNQFLRSGKLKVVVTEGE